MTEASVLLLGSSNMHWDLDGAPALLTLLRAELEAQDPSREWSVTGHVVQPGRTMASEVSRLAAEHRPHAVVVTVGAAMFVYEYVSEKIKRRAPALHATSVWVSQHVKLLAGGDSDSATGPRGLIWRIPEAVAFRAIGGRPIIRLDHAIANTAAALEALSRNEDMALVFRLPAGGVRASGARARRYQERLDAYNAALRDICVRHHIPVLDVAGLMAAEGRRPTHAFDGIHIDLPTRQFEANAMARAILTSMDGGTPAQRAHGTISVAGAESGNPAL